MIPYSVFRILVLAMLASILVSLGVAFYHMCRGREHSRSTVKALTMRVVLSIGLFVLLMLAAALGLVAPHQINGHF